uniref:MSP domain-containing protein n=1 Tax=Magallana gigas TaxID=29159 RepID=A0A8W8K7V1_MAGGI|nr:uncharacterized protein LOC105342229 [Crassostrea gigas]
MKSVTVHPEVLSMTANSTFQSETSFTIENITSEEIKFKVRFSNDANFSSKPIIGNIPAKSKETVKVCYVPKERIQIMDLCKFQLHVIGLSGLQDNGPSTFADAPEKVEKGTFSISFFLPLMDDALFCTPKSTIEVGAPDND